MGAAARRTSRPRRSSAPTGSCGCGTTRRGRSTTRSGSAAATARPSATTTSGGCPGRRHVRRERSALPLHPEPAGLPGRPSGLADQPEPGRPHVRRPRARLPGLPDERPGVREQGARRRGPHLRPGEHEPGPADDRDPVRVLPRDRVARRPRAGRCRAPQAPRAGAPRGLPHTDPAFYLGAAATWANAYITGRTTPPTR